jgi:biopolymer transport protein ExbD
MALEIIRSRHKPMTMNVTPLIDVVFQLLIFFLLTTSFVNLKNFDLMLPGDRTAEVRPAVAIFVRIRTDRSVTVDGVRIPLDRLNVEIASLIKNNPARAVLLGVDDDVPVQILVTAMEKIRGGGALNVRMTTPDEEVQAEGSRKS